MVSDDKQAPLRTFQCLFLSSNQVRGLVLGTSKLIITTALFVLLLYFSEVRSLATGVCGVLLTAAAVLTLRASSSAGDDGDDEESAALAQRR